MPKQKTKDSKVTSFSLDVKVLDRLDEYSKKTYIPKTRIVEIAVTEYLDRIEEHNTDFKRDKDYGN